MKNIFIIGGIILISAFLLLWKYSLPQREIQRIESTPYVLLDPIEYEDYEDEDFSPIDPKIYKWECGKC